MKHFKLFFLVLFSCYGNSQEANSNNSKTPNGSLNRVTNNSKTFVPITCDYVLNGNFENHTGFMTNGTNFSTIVHNWFTDNNSGADYFHSSSPTPNYDIPFSYGASTANATNSILPGSGNAYTGMSVSRDIVGNDFSYGSELMFTQLNAPLLPNTSYRLSFHALRRHSMNNNDSPEIQACLVNSSGFPITQFDNFGNLTPPPGSILLDDRFITNDNQWQLIEFTFLTTDIAEHNYLYIGSLIDPEYGNVTDTTSLAGAYLFIDNVALTTVFNPVFTMPNTICSNATSFDLNTLLTGETEGGFFTINGTQIIGNTFDPSTVGEGTYTITYTIPNTIACTQIVVSSTIVVSFCEPNKPYISQTYAYGTNKFVEVKNADENIDIVPNTYFLAIYLDGLNPLTNAPSSYIDLNNISTQGTKVFKSQFANTPSYTISNPTWTGLNNFDGYNDIIIITTTTDNTAYANRIDMVGNNTSWCKKTSIVRVSCTPMGFPRTDAFDERDWVEFTTSEVANDHNRSNSILGRHFSETLTWDGNAWDDFGNLSNPDRSRYEVIDGPYNTDTAITGSFEACSILVNEPLDISANQFVKVQISVDVSIPEGIRIANNGSLVMVRDCYYNNVCGTDLINLNSTTGMTLTRETVNLDNQYDYVYWSSPLSSLSTNPTAGQIFNFGGGTGPIFGMHRFYSFENQNYCDIYRKYNVAQPLETDGYDDNLNDYLPFTHPNNTGAQNQQLIPGRGYNTWPPAPATPGNYNYTIEFKGEMNNGIVTVPLYKNNSEKGKNSNLVGNPYPSAIDLNTLFAVNSTLIEPIVYVWSRIADAPNTIPGPEGYNYTAANFTVYTPDFNLNEGNNTAFGGNNIISSGQSFFVRTYKNFDGFSTVSVPADTISSTVTTAHPLEEILPAGNLVFNNSMRTTAPNNTFSRIAGQSTIVKSEGTTTDKLWVNLTDANGFKIQLGIGFKPTANSNYIPGEDFGTISGRKYNFYTQSTPEDLMIDIQDAFSVDKVIPLGITNTNSKENQSFSISIPKKEGVFEKQEVYLYDSFLNVYHNLSNGNYSFKTLSNIIEGRFSLCFTNNSTNFTKQTTNSQVDVKCVDGKIFVKSANQNIQAVYVSDIYTPNSSGLTVAKNERVNQKETSLTVQDEYKLLNVKIVLEDGSVVSKKIFK